MLTPISSGRNAATRFAASSRYFSGPNGIGSNCSTSCPAAASAPAITLMPSG